MAEGSEGIMTSTVVENPELRNWAVKKMLTIPQTRPAPEKTPYQQVMKWGLHLPDLLVGVFPFTPTAHEAVCP